MPIQLATRGVIYWSIPLSLFAGGFYTFTKLKQHNAIVPQGLPLQYTPSGEQSFDNENMEKIRAEWRLRNNGIGLRDVR
ncbi:hypothetical protein K501DRAFT_220380 [Backusella circina FSU 941]|nr:hypothetical protein K501DRAFT_220380 [Backusella circina FSU 941]